MPASGWRDVLLRLKERLSRDRLSIISAGVAFYALLAIFPGLAALVSVYGLIANPDQLANQLQSITAMMPSQASGILMQQVHAIASSDGGALSAGVVVGIVLALWSASAGVKTLMTALNVAYHEGEERGFFRFNGIALALTLALVAGAALVIGLVVALPGIVSLMGFGGGLKTLIDIARWPVLALAMMAALGLMYRFGPSRDHPRCSWVTPGAVIALVLWLTGTVLFSVYANNFGKYNATYGSLGAVVVLLTWLLLSAYAILIGAEINAEMERQTGKDTTVGEPRRRGERGAYAADAEPGRS